MEANEAPEKIYIPTILAANTVRYKEEGSIEYVRTDAFIEKAEEFIYSALNDGIMGTANIEDFMKLFKKYMED